MDHHSDGIKPYDMTQGTSSPLIDRNAVWSVGSVASASDAFNWRAYAATLGMVGGAIIIGMILRQFLESPNITLVFLTAVLASAVAYGLWPSLFGCFVSVLAYNVFFLQPLYTVTIADPENIVAMFFFVVVAV